MARGRDHQQQSGQEQPGGGVEARKSNQVNSEERYHTVLCDGLYEQVVSRLLARQLEGLAAGTIDVDIEPLDSGDSHVALSTYVQQVLSRVLDTIRGEQRLERQVATCNEVVRSIAGLHPELGLDEAAIAEGAQRLMSLLRKGSTWSRAERPDTPLAAGSLLTGTRLDPSLASQLRKEISTSDRIDILCSFLKWSGVRIIGPELESFCDRPGTRLRIITTSYMGATDIKAVDFLQELRGTDLRVSYDTRRTRLHAKAYMFHRASGFGQAYIGSANVSHAALTDGLEWNVKISQYESPHLWRKATATFETYWNDAEFVSYGAGDRPRLKEALDKERESSSSDMTVFSVDLHPYGFQQEILDKLAAERQFGERDRHLVVAATGTGKTMIAAFDYRNWCASVGNEAGQRPSLLFIAHREEILKQSLWTFRMVLRDQNFGDLLVAGNQPEQTRHLFASIQTLNSQGAAGLPTDQYDYVVVDEFHHAAARSYETILAELRPRVLLGLTATPERGDGLDVLRHFGGHISAEIRLPDAINRKLLCPFQYFGVTDSVDLSVIRWQRGGYAVDELDHVYTDNDLRADSILRETQDKLLDVRQARGLGFCVSVAHAEYMAKYFNTHGVPSAALSAETDRECRRTIQDRLRTRAINFIFVVDLYNEGIDIPEIDTVLFLRPTESPTVFLQQLGRGLRLLEDKECLTVLDFIGRANRSFRFDLRFRALMADQTQSVEAQIEQGFPHLPAGCTIQIERVARGYVLENIRQNLRQSRTTLIREMKAFQQNYQTEPTLSSFVEKLNLETDDIYRRGVSWSRLCVEAGIRPSFTEPDEAVLTKGLRRMQHVNSAPYIRRLLEIIGGNQTTVRESTGSEEDRRMLAMLYFSLWGGMKTIETYDEVVRRLSGNPCLREELVELLGLRLSQVGTVAVDLRLPFVCPLTLHSLYTRDEILAALGRWSLTERPDMREGVLHLKEISADVFLTTLNKTEKDYSPSTMYQDYAISEQLFHWQSQSTTSEESPTGRRYVEHVQRGYTVLLFTREHKQAAGLASPYYFLGPADYQSHEGSRPMSIVWRLRHPIPAQLLRRTARLAVG